MSKHTDGDWWASYLEVGSGPTMAVKIARVSGANYGEALANAKLIAAAPGMLAVLDDLEDSFDKEIYPEQKKEDFDALDNREYTVTITAKQWRALGRAIAKATTQQETTST